MQTIDRAADILRMFDIEPKPMDRLLAAYFKKHREVSSRERRFVADSVFGVARWRRRIDGWLSLAGVRRADNRDRVSAWMASGAEIAGLAGEKRKRFPGGDAAFFSYPDALYEMMIEKRGRPAAATLAMRMNEPSAPALRVNSLKMTRDEALRALAGEGTRAEPTARSPYGIRLAARTARGGLPLFAEGLVEFQDEASQLVAQLADPKPGSRVLDACAGAGGKSLALAALMGDEGEIVAWDADVGKLKELRRRAARAGVKSIKTCAPGSRRSAEGGFDLVFIDAPCSGTGTLRRAPDLRWRVTEEMVAGMVRVQSELLAEHAVRLRPGGRLVYATCSILARENEGVMGPFLKRSGMRVVGAGGELTRLGVNAKGITTEGGFLFTDPLVGEWDGFFAALIEG